MYRDRDFDPGEALPAGAEEVTQDLALHLLWEAMAAGDAYLRAVAERGTLLSLTDADAIRYRQAVLADCLQQPQLVRRLYAIAVDALEREGHVWGFTARRPESVLHRALQVLRILLDALKQLRRIADEEHAVKSEGLTSFFAMLSHELGDAYLGEVQDHLQRLAFRNGLLMSAELGEGNKGVRYVVREPPARKWWLERLEGWVQQLSGERPTSYTYEIAERDEAGLQALGELRSHGIAPVARALGTSTDHLLGFFRMLRAELGFYVGCVNLAERLARQGRPVCMPEPVPAGPMLLEAQGLYDLSLSLTLCGRIVANDVQAHGPSLVIITGASRGGKTTFLRSVGQARLMMQCGLFVPARSLRASLCSGFFTHFKREEDVGLESGKLDEELRRMSDIVDQVRPGGLVLLNESFASTNEREAAEIARQVLRGLLHRGIQVLYVTHLFDLARSLQSAPPPQGVMFLRAERLVDGQRTFRVLPGEPRPTSHGMDLYRQIFGATREQELTGKKARAASSDEP